MPERFFQYALSPEDEARNRGTAHRRRRPPERRDARASIRLGPARAAAFAEEFAAAGGQVVDQADYLPSTADFNEILRRLLRTTGQRGSAPRPDAQFMFVAAQPVHGRMIRTQLRFNYASALPMYSTSDIYDPAGPGNVDLDGVIFPDMPWVLDPQGASAAAHDMAERVFPGRSGPLGRLYAFGYDAFRLVNELPRLRGGSQSPLPGVTGRLAVDVNGRVRRELDWAQIVGGRVVPWPTPPGRHANLVSTAPHLALGRAAEAAAARFLERHGYQVLTTNFAPEAASSTSSRWTAPRSRSSKSATAPPTALAVPLPASRRENAAASSAPPAPCSPPTRRSPSCQRDSTSSRSVAPSTLSTAS